MMLEKEIARLREAGYHDIAEKVEMTLQSLEDKERWLTDNNLRLQYKCMDFQHAMLFVTDSCATDHLKCDEVKRALAKWGVR